MGREMSAGTQRVVLLNGPAGVGKTTIGRRLAATARNGICVHGDDLKHFVVSRDPDTVQSGLSYVGGAALADVFLDAGYELVVFEFIFTRHRHIKRFLDALRSDAPVHLLTLWAPLATVVAREAARADRERLGGHVTECWHELATSTNSACSSTLSNRWSWSSKPPARRSATAPRCHRRARHGLSADSRQRVADSELRAGKPSSSGGGFRLGLSAAGA
jgi:chloramphenicol 3-O-phosphotransferase